jgi:asparagine synthase (glutamine-hydrolysing)
VIKDIIGSFISKKNRFPLTEDLIERNGFSNHKNRFFKKESPYSKLSLRLFFDESGPSSLSNFLYESTQSFLLDTSGEIKLIDENQSLSSISKFQKWAVAGSKFQELVEGPSILLDYNSTLNRMILSRDRFGSKPLYWLKFDDVVYFSSSVNLLLSLNSIKMNINWNLVARYIGLNYRMVYGRGQTIAEQVNEVPLASQLVLRENSLTVNSYWSPPNSTFSFGDEENLLSDYKINLDRVVSSKINNSNNPVFLISGGLDAPLIAAKAAQLLKTRIPTYGAIFPDNKNFDESSYINLLNSRIAGESKLFDLSETDFISTFNDLINFQDQPLVSPTYVLFYYMLKSAKDDGFTEIFGGGGGDIVSQGCLEYQPYVLADYKSLDRDIYDEELRKWQDNLGPHLRYWPSKPKDMDELVSKLCDDNSKGKIRNNPDWIALDYNILGSAYASTTIRIPEIDTQFDTYRQSRIFEELRHQAIAGHFVEEINIKSVGGIKTIDPFWDVKFVEFGFKLPLNLILKNGWTKYIVRKTSESILPDEFLSRADKSGLGVPLEIWFRGGLMSKEIEGILKHSELFNGKILNLDYFQAAFQSHKDGKSNQSEILWKLYALDKWFARWGNYYSQL